MWLYVTAMLIKTVVLWNIFVLQVKVDIGQERRIFRAAFFGNLDPSVTEDDIMSFLEEKLGEGCVSKIRLAKHEDGVSREFAHVDFRESSIRDKALLELNGLELKGIRCNVVFFVLNACVTDLHVVKVIIFHVNIQANL